MAQLKDLLVSGPSRLIGKLFANEVQLTTLNIPTASNGTTYGPGTSGQALVTNGTSAYWKTITIADIGGSAVLGVAKGGTGNTVATQGGIVYGNGTTYALTAAGSANQYLKSNGTSAPTWQSALNLTAAGALGWNSGGATNADNLRLVNVNAIAYWNGAYSGTSSNLKILGTVTTGTWNATKIAIGYGGTNATSVNKYGVVYGNADSNAYASTVAGTANYLLKSGGGTAAPSWVAQSDITAGKATADGSGNTITSTYVKKAGDTMTGDLSLQPSSSSSNDSPDIVWKYGDGTEKMRIWSPDSPTAKQGPNFRIYKSDGTSLYSGTLVTADGSGASGTWGISISGNAATATSASTATTANKLGSANVGSATVPVFFNANGVPEAITSLSLNAATATKFASSQKVKLEGDVTGEVSSQAGWTITTTLASTGVTATTYGPSANVSPTHGGTFTVPYFEVDAKGRIVSASTKTITLPTDNNTDTLVTQTNTTGDASYRLLLSESANDTTETKTARKSTKLQFNPSSGKLTLSGGAHINQAYTGTATAAANNSGTYTPAKWTFNLGFDPVTGDTIIIKTPGAGSDYGVFLSTDNGANYHPIRVWASNSRLTTHYAAGSYVELTYDSTQITNDVFAAGGATARSHITGSWNVVSYYDSNTTRVWNLYKCYGNYVANNIIKRYQILFQGLKPNEKKLIALYETDNNTATGKTLLTSTEFDPLGEIFYYNNTNAYAAGNTIDAGRLDWTALADLRFTFNITNDASIAATTAFRGVAPNPLYLRVTINSATGGAKVDTNQPLTSTLPTTADGKYYIYLGNIYDWYRVYLNRDHPVYFHNGTKLTEYKGNTTTTNQLVLTGSTNATMTAASTNPKITFMENANTQPVHLIYTDQDSYRSPAGLKIIGGTSATPAWLEVEGTVYAAGFNGPLSGNASTATLATSAQKFNTSRTIALTGDTTGSNSGDGSSGWSISTKTDRISTVGDNRTVATTPNDYSNKIIFQGLKTNSSFGSPSSDTYSYVIGLRGWSDSSGGNSHEFAFNNTGIYRRNGATTTWGNWLKILDSGNYTDYTVTKTGTGASGSWGISITGSSASCTGNAATATKISTNGTSGQLWAMTSDSAQSWINQSTITAGKATKLETARNLGVALNSTTAVTFDGSANQTSIPVSGTLAIANGGTNMTSVTSKGIVYATSTTALATTTAGAAGQVLTSNGSSSNPGWTTATNANTASTIVKRDSNGDFSARQITADYFNGTATKADTVGVSASNNASLYLIGVTTNTSGMKILNATNNIHVQNNVLIGAAWNDYAEYRETEVEIEPGRVVIENGDDTLSLSTERMQPGAEIVSDTFGFAIGETKKSKTPIAASGRVLAYPHEPRRTYKPGQPVCSGPNGTVSQMTDEEARMYPWLIIGTVSSVPDYEAWGEGKVKVNGRIWIRIR